MANVSGELLWDKILEILNLGRSVSKVSKALLVTVTSSFFSQVLLCAIPHFSPCHHRNISWGTTSLTKPIKHELAATAWQKLSSMLFSSHRLVQDHSPWTIHKTKWLCIFTIEVSSQRDKILYLYKEAKKRSIEPKMIILTPVVYLYCVVQMCHINDEKFL